MPKATPKDRDYRDTLNLPKTDFPMRADLPQREPERLLWWEKNRPYERRLAANSEAEPWILHDGPPYANGELHMGHFLNMVLKDIFVKLALLDGRAAKFVPGWDMHGLPIELETLKHLGLDVHAVDALELRAQCRERALHWLEVQRTTRKRMGNFGDFEHPYRTIDPEFEGTIADALAQLAEAQQIYKGLRSTLWCFHDETALAEAEIEYKERVSPAVFVRFSADDEQRLALAERFGLQSGELPSRVSVLIWTTTPWTLPANVAIALRGDAHYGCFRHGDEALIVATALAPRVFAALEPQPQLLATTSGENLSGLTLHHPFLARDSTIVTADYVDLETGTGAVHTAPGHGADDFETGLRYSLPTLVPVDARGVFTSEAGPYAGLQVFAANPAIVDDLRRSGALFAEQQHTHSYPHCWRCHNPVIFRATSQWFIAMDVNRLRRRVIEAVAEVDWIPGWGRERMVQMMESHPEWCISRQRTWGTPIPAIACRSCGESLLDPEVARNAARRFRDFGSDAWYRDDVESFLPESYRCPNCQGAEFEKEFDIVDIWFESGVTHLAVLDKPGLPWPSDLVLEGGDQYRGWFRSSLVTGVAIKGAPPYRCVLKNGWVVDADGRAMHKSTGNYIAAEEAMQTYGADVLRLWAASVEFTDDVRFGPALLDNVRQVYRNLRYRARYLLSVLYDLHANAVVPAEKMEPLDALALNATDAASARIAGNYRAFNLHDAYLALMAFEGDDLSRFYLDALKDRLYSSAPDAPRRRSAQSACWYILQRYLTLLAPILPFTAEEAWQCVPPDLRADRSSVFDLPLQVTTEFDAGQLARWEQLKVLRSHVAATEAPRDFEARALVSASPEHFEWLQSLGDGLREALVVSAIELTTQASGSPSVALHKAEGKKCSRCWKYIAPAGVPVCAQCDRILRDMDAA